jgi:hypothetical protein
MIGHGGANNPTPITLPFRTVDQSSPMLSIPVVGPQSDVQGFEMPAADESPTQQQAEALAVKLQSFYDGLSGQEQLILSAVLGQAAAYCE